MPNEPSTSAAPERKALEQADVLPVTEFPKRVVLRLAREDGQTFECEMGPAIAHDLSNNLLKAVAAIVPRTGT